MAAEGGRCGADHQVAGSDGSQGAARARRWVVVEVNAVEGRASIEEF